MTDPIWLELIKQTPTTAAIIVVVWYFIGFIKHQNEASAAERKESNERWQAFQREMHERTSESLEKCASALERNSEALGWSNGVKR